MHSTLRSESVPWGTPKGVTGRSRDTYSTQRISNLEHNLKTSASVRYRTYTKVTSHYKKQPSESNLHESVFPPKNNIQNLPESVFPPKKQPTESTWKCLPTQKKQSTESTRKCPPPQEKTTTWLIEKTYICCQFLKQVTVQTHRFFNFSSMSYILFYITSRRAARSRGGVSCWCWWGGPAASSSAWMRACREGRRLPSPSFSPAMKRRDQRMLTMVVSVPAPNKSACHTGSRIEKDCEWHLACGWDLAEWLERLTANAVSSQLSWVRSQLPPTQWNLRGGWWSSVEYRTQKRKNEKKIPLKNHGAVFCVWCEHENAHYKFPCK